MRILNSIHFLLPDYLSTYFYMIIALRELHRLLAKHDNPGQAEIVATLIELHSNNQQEFDRLLQSGYLWGGSGSVWEVGEMGADTRTFRDAIISLVTAMEEAGLATEGSRDIAHVLGDWNAKGQ